MTSSRVAARPIQAQPPAAAPLDPGDAIDWGRVAAVSATTVAGTALGVYGGGEIGAHVLGHQIADATAGTGLWAPLVALVELARGMYFTVLPWMVGTGAVGGATGYAVGRAATRGATLDEVAEAQAKD